MLTCLEWLLAIPLKHEHWVLQRSLAVYEKAVHRPPTDADGPPVKMPSPTRKRHRLALASSPAADAAVAAAGDLAAEAVLQAAAAAKTPAEAATAAEHAAEVVTAAAADAVGSPAPLPGEGSRGAKADRVEVGIAHNTLPPSSPLPAHLMAARFNIHSSSSLQIPDAVKVGYSDYTCPQVFGLNIQMSLLPVTT